MKTGFRWKEIYATNLRLGLGKIVKGIDYSRIIEYPLAFSQLEFQKKNLILDVGSSDSVFPIFLASLGHKVQAIDIDQKALRLAQFADKLGMSNLAVAIHDVTKLPYPDNHFDIITAISAIEHVLPVRNGDTDAVKEISRTLKVGGQTIITVPYGDDYEVTWSRSRMSKDFSLLRKYGRTAIYERLVKPSGLLLENQAFFGESIEFSKIWYNSPFSLLAFPAPFFAKLFMRVREMEKPEGICLKLRKYDRENVLDKTHLLRLM